MSTQTLDAVLKSYPHIDADILSLNTEGTEFEILEGSSETIKTHLLALEVEVSFIPLRLNQKLFHEIFSQMQSLNFTLFDLQRYYWQREGAPLGQYAGQLVFGNALFFRSPENLQNLSEEKIKKYVQLLVLYGYFDIAFQVLQMHLISEDTKKLMFELMDFTQKKYLKHGTQHDEKRWYLNRDKNFRNIGNLS